MNLICRVQHITVSLHRRRSVTGSSCEKGKPLSEFETKSFQILSSLQENLLKIISFFGDPVAIRPVDLRDLLSIDMNLAWKISHLAGAADVFSLGKYLPGKKAVTNFISQAAKAGVPPADVSALKKSFKDLDWLVRSYAGSRKELEVILAGLSTEERTGNDSLHRRKSFEGNSYTFGVQSDLQLSTNILIASDRTPGTVDICRIRGQVGLYRTRPDVPWRVSGTSILDADGKVKDSAGRQYLFPFKGDGPALIEKYSSAELPEFGSVTDSMGRKSFYLKGHEIGIRSAINIFTAETMINSGHLYRRNPAEGAALVNTSRTPTRKYAVELYLPEEFSGSAWEVEMWSMLFPASEHSAMTPGDRLPLSEQPVVYRPGSSPVPLPGVSVYSDLILDCFSKINRDIKTYSMLRLTMDFPPIPASLDFIVSLPEKP